MRSVSRSGRSVVILLVGAIAAIVSAEVLTARGARGADASQAEPPSEATLAIGQTLFGDHCGRCHDQAGGRAPSREDLSAYAPDAVVEIATNGPMRPMAAGLSPDEIQSIASYLTGKSPTAAGAGKVAFPASDLNPCMGPPPPLRLDGEQWNGWGRDLDNSRYQPDPGLKAADLPRLKVKWAFAYPGGHDGQPTLVGDRVFLSAASGRVYSLDARTGCVRWRHDATAGVRTSLVIGRVNGRPTAFYGDLQGRVEALDAATGALIWSTRIETHPKAVITGSPVLYRGRLYVPASSLEEEVSQDRAYACCTFRGSVTALDAASGKLLWKTYPIRTAPAPFKVNSEKVQMFGPAGGAIWSSPTIDPRRGVLYTTTGDSYTDVPTDGADAVAAIALKTGHIRWIRQVTKDDDFLVGCGRAPNPASCPDRLGPDFDFGSSAILQNAGKGRQVLLAGQKSGIVYAFDPDHAGKILWQETIGHGSALGGVEWGMAAHAGAVYAAISDVGAPEGQGKPGLTAMSIAGGKQLWHVGAPPAVCAWGKTGRCNNGFSAAVSLIPGAVISGGQDGHLRAFSTKDGAELWDFDTAAAAYRPVNIDGEVKGGTIDATGPTLANGMLFQNSGYGGYGGAARGANVLLAFSVDGQ